MNYANVAFVSFHMTCRKSKRRLPTTIMDSELPSRLLCFGLPAVSAFWLILACNYSSRLQTDCDHEEWRTECNCRPIQSEQKAGFHAHPFFILSLSFVHFHRAMMGTTGVLMTSSADNVYVMVTTWCVAMVLRYPSCYLTSVSTCEVNVWRSKELMTFTRLRRSHVTHINLLMSEAFLEVGDEGVLGHGIQKHRVAHAHVVLQNLQSSLVKRHGCA